MNRDDLHKLSRIRLLEARTLFAAGLYSGAYYLSGYAVECALKACIAKQTQRYDFPDKARVMDSYVHKLSKLMEVANLSPSFRLATQTNPRLQASWDVLNNWSEQSRYEPWTNAEADAMIQAASQSKNGVLQWIKLHW